MILDRIVRETTERVKQDKELCSFLDIQKKATLLKGKQPFGFEEALRGEGVHFICEVKRASPSKGIIAEDFPYLKIARDYEAAGASCISVLTEPNHFLGNDKYLFEIATQVHIPVLRKDFILDEYQIYQAKVLGADCVLLIVSILSFEQLTRYIKLCSLLAISALIEVHSEEEIKIALAAGARLIGINNRDLNSFQVNIENSLRLRPLIPKGIIVVAESGIKSREDIKNVKRANIHAVLIGEALMQSSDKKAFIEELRG